MMNIQQHPRKSILKHTWSSTEKLDSKQSWFSSKLNSFNNDTQTRLFSSFKKRPQEDLTPRQMRRVRFPVTDMLSEDTTTVSEKGPVDTKTLLSLYETICRNNQKPTIDLLVSILVSQPNATTCLTRLDLSNQLISRYSISPLADILYVNFGLQELILNNCGLENTSIRILMNSLLDNDTIKYLGLAQNPKLDTPAFHYIAVYIKGSRHLSTLDLSYTRPNKNSLEYLLSASVKPSSLNCLLLNGCNLRTPQLLSIRNPNCTIKELSLTGNQMTSQGALAIGVMLRDYYDQSSSSLHGLEKLVLDNNNELGMEYIAQALKRNQGLRYFSVSGCKLNSKNAILLFEALKYNTNLETLNVANNPLCLDSIKALAQALKMNATLKDLCLSNTNLSTQAITMLAQCLSENTSLIRLDLSKNPHIQYSCLLAISTAMKFNRTLTFIDININTSNKEMVEIHNKIIAACTRNAQTTVTRNKPVTARTAQLSLRERLAAAVTRNSNRDHIDRLIQQALDGILDFEEKREGAYEQCKQLHTIICAKVPKIQDSTKLEVLLGINDRLTGLLDSHKRSLLENIIVDKLSGSFEIGDDDDDEDDDDDDELR